MSGSIVDEPSYRRHRLVLFFHHIRVAVRWGHRRRHVFHVAFGSADVLELVGRPILSSTPLCGQLEGKCSIRLPNCFPMAPFHSHSPAGPVPAVEVLSRLSVEKLEI